jgi:hypothetical protein
VPDPSVQPPEGLRGAHSFEIVSEKQRKRGWYLRWRCRRLDCDSRGDMTVDDQDAAHRLFSLLTEGHARLAAD